MANYNTTATDCGCSRGSNTSSPMRSQPCVHSMTRPAMQQPCGSSMARPAVQQTPCNCTMTKPAMQQPCGGRLPDPVGNMPLAMAYVPWQCFQEVYEPDKALQYGTIFPELNKPFYGRGGCMR